MAYDLLVRGGQVVDPAQGIRGRLDVAIRQGMVAALFDPAEAPEAAAVLDAGGLLVTPGLIDLHTHVAEALITVAAAPDQAGVLSGVTAVADAGSTGWANVEGLFRYVMPGARTDIFCFLHLCPVGEALLPEVGWEEVSADKMLEVVEAHRDTVKGIKLRLTAALVEGPGPEAVGTARQVAAAAGLPLMVHLGLDAGESLPEPELAQLTTQALDLLAEGDVLTHAFTAKPGGVFRRDGSPVPGLREAVERGVRLDVAAALGHLDFEIARRAMERGFLPATISTDFTAPLLNAPVPISLAVVMSEFLALGLSLEQVVEAATANPARVLGETERRGSLHVGMPADLSLFETVAGDFLFVEGRQGKTMAGDRLLVPKLAIKRGAPFETAPRARSYAQVMDHLRGLSR